MLRDFSTFSRTCIFFLLTLSLLWSSLFFSSLLWLFPPLLFHLSILSEVWLLNFPSIIDDDWLWLWYFKLRSGSATNLSEWVYCDSILYYVLFPAIHTQFCWQKYPIIWRRSFPSSNRWGLLLTWIQNLSQPLLSRAGIHCIHCNATTPLVLNAAAATAHSCGFGKRSKKKSDLTSEWLMFVLQILQPSGSHLI